MFLISGTMVLAFGIFSVLGTGVSVLMGIGGILSGDGEMLIGIPMAMAYGTFMVVGLLSGGLQLAGGVRLLRGQKDTLTWVATFAAIASVITVYCAPPGLLAFALGLAAMVSPATGKAAADAAPVQRGEGDGPGEPFDPPAA